MDQDFQTYLVVHGTSVVRERRSRTSIDFFWSKLSHLCNAVDFTCDVTSANRLDWRRASSLCTSMSNPQITLLYFAAASTATGRTMEKLSLPASPAPFRLSALGTLLIDRYPDTNIGKVLQGSQWSVDAEMVDDPEEFVLKGGEEVAVICPVSGG